MRLKDAQRLSETNRDKARDLLRQFALAGLAIIWFFKVDASRQTDLDFILQDPAAQLVAVLLLDLLQYLLAAAIWAFHAWRHGSPTPSSSDDIPDKPAFKGAIFFCFVCEIGLFFKAYLYLLGYLMYRFQFFPAPN